MKNKTCPHCKQKYATSNANQKFCSSKCNSSYHWDLRRKGLKDDATSRRRSTIFVNKQFFDWREYKDKLIV